MVSALESTSVLERYRKNVRNKDMTVNISAEVLISLIKRRHIRGSRECAEATAYLLRRVVESFRTGDVTKLLERVQGVGLALTAALPEEAAIGNVVWRVLGLIREEVEEDREGDASGYSDTGSESQSQTPQADVATEGSSSILHRPSPLRRDGIDERFSSEANNVSHRSMLHGSQYTSALPGGTPATSSMFNTLSNPFSTSRSTSPAPGAHSPAGQSSLSTHALANLNAAKELRAEIVEGIGELLDEIRQADDQIAGYALEHIHSNEIIFTNSASTTVQKFLLKAAAKRKFTVIHVEAYPNENESTYEALTGQSRADNRRSDQFTKTLTGAGVTVILVPDSAVFALMARVNKVVLDAQMTFANGGSVISSGSKGIAKAARYYRAHVLVLSSVYKLSPVHPFDTNAWMKDGDPSKVVSYEDGDFIDMVDVVNPLFDYLPSNLVDLYITNVGGHTPSSLNRVVGDHYRAEDVNLYASNSLP